MKRQFKIFLIMAIFAVIIIFFAYQMTQKQSSKYSNEKNYSDQINKGRDLPLQYSDPPPLNTKKQFIPIAQDIIGTWYIVSSNPKYKNKIITDYTKFTFYLNGKLDRNQFTSDKYKIDAGKYAFLEDDKTFPITFGTDDIKKSNLFWKLDEEGLAQSYYKSKKDSVYIKEGSKEWDKREKITITTELPISFINPNDLQIGKTYELSKKTPLMPEVNPVDSIAALGDMRELSAGSAIKIISIAQKNNTPWYNVGFINYSTGNLDYGWINSIALYGQSLKEK
ncbi:hypothetical protein KAU09_01180 [Candidatus Parcubacteria bacterium]|nr:hypothetical protein [Candidatus Parcubacteria bacterium]